MNDSMSDWERRFKLICARIASEYLNPSEIVEVVLQKATPDSVQSWAAHCLLAQLWRAHRDAGNRVVYTEVSIPGDFPIEEACVKGAYADLVQICKNPNVQSFVSHADLIEVNTGHIIVECSYLFAGSIRKRGRRDVGAMDIVMKPAEMIRKKTREDWWCPGLHFTLRENTYRGRGGSQRPALMQSSTDYPGGFCFGKRRSYVASCAYDLRYALIINEALFAFTLTGGWESSIFDNYPAVGKDSIKTVG